MIVKAEFYGKDGDLESAAQLSWVDSEGYFGEANIISGPNGMRIYSETMGKDFVKKLLCQLVDEAELKE